MCQAGYAVRKLRMLLRTLHLIKHLCCSNITLHLSKSNRKRKKNRSYLISGRNSSCFDQNHRQQIHNNICLFYFFLRPNTGISLFILFFSFVFELEFNNNSSFFFIGNNNSSIGNKMRFLKSNLEERALTT